MLIIGYLCPGKIHHCSPLEKPTNSACKLTCGQHGNRPDYVYILITELLEVSGSMMITVFAYVDIRYL